MTCRRCREREASVRFGDQLCFMCAMLPERVAAAIDACQNIETRELRRIALADDQVHFALIWAKERVSRRHPSPANN